MPQRLIGGLAGRWFAPVPPQRLAALRMAVGAFATLYCAGRGLYWAQVSRLPAYRWEPIGPLAWLGSPPPALAVYVAMAAVVGLGGAFTVGWRYRAVAPLHAALLVS